MMMMMMFRFVRFRFGSVPISDLTTVSHSVEHLAAETRLEWLC